MKRTFREWAGPYRVFLFTELVAAIALNIVNTTAVLYRVVDAHLNPLELVGVGTVLEVSYLIFQLPTGMFADARSRRLLIIAGMFVLGTASMLEGSVATFAVIASAQVVNALGFALVNGAEEAWIADELAEENMTPVYVRGTQVGLVGSLIGAVLSAPLSGLSHRFTFFIGGAILMALGLALCTIMTEKGFTPTHRPAKTAGMLRQVRQVASTSGRRTWKLMRVQPAIVMLLAVMFSFGSASEGFDRLGQARIVYGIRLPHWFNLSEAWWLSIFAVVATAVGLGVSEIVRRQTTAGSNRCATNTFVGVMGTWVLAVTVLGITGNFVLAAVAFSAAGAVRSSLIAILNGWLVKAVRSDVRATTLSVAQMADSAGQIMGGPIIGALSTVVSVGAGLVASAAAALPALVLPLRGRSHLEVEVTLIEPSSALEPGSFGSTR